MHTKYTIVSVLKTIFSLYVPSKPLMSLSRELLTFFIRRSNPVPTMADLQFNWFGINQASKSVLISITAKLLNPNQSNSDTSSHKVREYSLIEATFTYYVLNVTTYLPTYLPCRKIR